MKKVLITALLAVFLTMISYSAVEAATRVRGHFRKSGAYVQPHYRSSPNRSKFDNWSTKGNYNPHTGKKGYASPYKFRFR